MTFFFCALSQPTHTDIYQHYIIIVFDIDLNEDNWIH